MSECDGSARRGNGDGGGTSVISMGHEEVKREYEILLDGTERQADSDPHLESLGNQDVRAAKDLIPDFLSPPMSNCKDEI
jgi:hypothetical protein